MILTGIINDLLVNIDPKLYRKFVVLEKQVKVLYVNLHKDLYRLLRSALLFYLKLSTDLKIYGFIINTYDPFVTKKLVTGESIAVVCHVEYPKVSHKDLFEVNNFAQYFSIIYEKN